MKKSLDLSQAVSRNHAALLRTIQQTLEAARNLIPAAGGVRPVSKSVERLRPQFAERRCCP